MGFLSRLSSKTPSNASRASGPVGRKFATEVDLFDSLEVLIDLLFQEFSGRLDLHLSEWTAPDPPDVLSAYTIAGAGSPLRRIDFAGWTRPEGAEIHLVRFDYAQMPTPPLVGLWKQRDRSLTSTGSVTHWPVRYM